MRKFGQNTEQWLQSAAPGGACYRGSLLATLDCHVCQAGQPCPIRALKCFSAAWIAMCTCDGTTLTNLTSPTSFPSAPCMYSSTAKSGRDGQGGDRCGGLSFALASILPPVHRRLQRWLQAAGQAGGTLFLK
jgi:hypothetical protein